jgi:Flp pilus assembly protein TadG
MVGAFGRLLPWFRGHDGGNMLIEFALALPVLCLMMVGMFDLGRFGLEKSAMLQGAREGAQYGIQALNDPNFSTNVSATAQNATGLGGVTATATVFYECTSGVGVSGLPPQGTVCGSGAAPKTYLTVQVTKAFASVLAAGGASFGSFGKWTAPTTVSASVTMICP